MGQRRQRKLAKEGDTHLPIAMMSYGSSSINLFDCIGCVNKSAWAERGSGELTSCASTPPAGKPSERPVPVRAIEYTARKLAAVGARTIVQVTRVDQEEVDVFFLRIYRVSADRRPKGKDTYDRELLHVRDKRREVSQITAVRAHPESHPALARQTTRRSAQLTYSWVPGRTSSGARGASHGCRWCG